jgi:hypothetical protein
MSLTGLPEVEYVRVGYVGMTQLPPSHPQNVSADNRPRDLIRLCEATSGAGAVATTVAVLYTGVTVHFPRFRSLDG